MKFATTKERIIYFIESQGISVKNFLSKTEIKRGFLDSDKLKATVSDVFIAKIIANYPELSVEWLLTGKGPMIKEKTTLSIDKASDKYNKPIKNDSKPAGIPLLPFDAFAGSGYELMEGINFDTIEERYEIPLFEGLQVDFMIPVRGSSMYPKYNSGDVVACRMIKELLFIQWNKVYVIDTLSQGVIMKRLKKSEHEDCIICKSDNKDYDEFELPKSEIRSVALVVGVVRLE